jgi:hypothetical protein
MLSKVSMIAMFEGKGMLKRLSIQIFNQYKKEYMYVSSKMKDDYKYLKKMKLT